MTRARQSGHRLAEISGSKVDVLAPRMELECLSVYPKKKKEFHKGPGTKISDLGIKAQREIRFGPSKTIILRTGK